MSYLDGYGGSQGLQVVDDVGCSAGDNGQHGAWTVPGISDGCLKCYTQFLTCRHVGIR
jgi:hypothetical protein